MVEIENEESIEADIEDFVRGELVGSEGSGKCFLMRLRGCSRKV